MAYTAEQQKRLNDALLRLNNAKAAYQGTVSSYNEYGSKITPCHDKKKTWYDASQAATWFNPDRANCVGSSPIHTQGCSNPDKNNCQALVDTVNQVVIPALRSAYVELNAAQGNYDKVVTEVATESKNDPEHILELHKADADALAKAAAAEAAAKVSILRWTFAIVVVVVIVVGIFIYLKWFKK